MVHIAFWMKKSGEIEPFASSDSSIYILTDTEEEALVSFDGVEFSVIPVKKMN